MNPLEIWTVALVIMMKDGAVDCELINKGHRKAFLEDILIVLKKLNGGDDNDNA